MLACCVQLSLHTDTECTYTFREFRKAACEVWPGLLLKREGENCVVYRKKPRSEEENFRLMAVYLQLVLVEIRRLFGIAFKVPLVSTTTASLKGTRVQASPAGDMYRKLNGPWGINKESIIFILSCEGLLESPQNPHSFFHDEWEEGK